MRLGRSTGTLNTRALNASNPAREGAFSFETTPPRLKVAPARSLRRHERSPHFSGSYLSLEHAGRHHATLLLTRPHLTQSSPAGIIHSF